MIQNESRKRRDGSSQTASGEQAKRKLNNKPAAALSAHIHDGEN